MNWRALIPETFGGNSGNIYQSVYNNLFYEKSHKEVSDKQKFVLARLPLWNWCSKNKPEKVLEIGFGSGVNSSVISSLTDCEYYACDNLSRQDSKIQKKLIIYLKIYIIIIF